MHCIGVLNIDGSYVVFVRTLTVKAVRHLLEQDLEFEKGALDAYKELVRTILDEVSSVSEHLWVTELL